ncbi:acyl carrier protein phosphodiesterase [Marinobacter sp. C2H3]|uniref:acyl carrier protein phosphodiesterase n=1 Tax=Marinobacter sp. C2H3 TaxID=3119003 RepID=UPI00300ED420
MNHLAHVFLAPDSAEARVGSVMGDFTRGVDLSALPADVRLGVHHHRRVDGFTDRHPEVLASKALFSPQRRRFAGVALDVLYDHFLLRHWSRYARAGSGPFIRQVYGEFRCHRDVMPDRMRRVTDRMASHDWFNAYRDLDNIGQALDRIAERVRFTNQFAGMIDEIQAHEDELEARFLRFFDHLHHVSEEFECD